MSNPATAAPASTPPAPTFIDAMLTKAPPAVTRGYFTYSATGHHLAVEKVGWQPSRAIGPLTPADLDKPVDSLDWSNAVPADRLNVRFLIPIVARELAYLKSGRAHRGVLVMTSGTGPAAMRAAAAGRSVK